LLSRRRIPLAIAGLCVLVLASAAAAAPNTFTAALTPAYVKPLTTAGYTLTLTSGATSDEVDRASVAIPTGFTDVSGVTAEATAGTGSCQGSAWVTGVADGKINLTRPNGGGNRNLCPGATLTVTFSAKSPAEEAAYLWTPELIAAVTGAEAFSFTGDATVNVDGTPPETNITSPDPPSPTNETSTSFEFSASEPGSFECSLDVVDGGAFAPCTSPRSYNGLPGGVRTFQVRAKDLAGNTDSSSASRTWTIDVVAPTTTITSAPPTTTTQTSAQFLFTSNEPGIFECSLDALNAGAFAPCTSPTNYAGLPGGTRTFRVRARDQAGNTSSPASWTWTITLVGPATQILTAPPSSTNSTSASFTFVASGQGSFECSLDGGLFSQCLSPTAYNSLDDGSHRFAVRTVGANSTGPEAAHTWSVDTRAPRAAVTSGPPGLSNSRSATFAFSADEPSSFQCRVDAGALAPCNPPISYQNLADGVHTFVAVPTDAVGNPGASASYGWTVDATAPQTTLGSRPASKTTASAATFRFAANEAASAFECKLDAGRFVPCTSPKRYARLRRSRHTFSVRAIDAAGNRDATPASHRWTVGLAKVASALISPAAGARIASPPLLRWRPVARASYYNVQVFRGGVKVLSVWPTRTRFQLRARWTFLGRQYRLSAGEYSWYVWPRFGRGAAGRYGNALGKSTFTVKASGRR
jgi:hypothetical protein